MGWNYAGVGIGYYFIDSAPLLFIRPFRAAGLAVSPLSGWLVDCLVAAPTARQTIFLEIETI